MEQPFLSQNEQFSIEVIGRFKRKEISRKEAAALLGISERQVQRRRGKVDANGIAGAKHGNWGRKPSNCIASEIVDQVIELMKNKYFNFSMHHALEMLVNHENIHISYSTFRRICHKHNFVKLRKQT